jgi:hypothetical protein
MKHSCRRRAAGLKFGALPPGATLPDGAWLSSVAAFFPVFLAVFFFWPAFWRRIASRVGLYGPYAFLSTLSKRHSRKPEYALGVGRSILSTFRDSPARTALSAALSF